METKETIEKIRTLEQSYRTIAHHEINKEETIRLFLDFHKTAGVAFLSIKASEAKPYFDKFMSINRGGNGFDLKKAFDSVYTEYEILMGYLEKEC